MIGGILAHDAITDKGGMGEVFPVRGTKLHRDVAIKASEKLAPASPCLSFGRRRRELGLSGHARDRPGRTLQRHPDRWNRLHVIRSIACSHEGSVACREAPFCSALSCCAGFA